MKQSSYLGRENIVKILLECGADLNHKDIAGKTPLEIAVENGKVS